MRVNERDACRGFGRDAAALASDMVIVMGRAQWRGTGGMAHRFIAVSKVVVVSWHGL
jgi:hypothetical protein